MKNNGLGNLIEPFHSTAERLLSGEKIELPENTMKDRKHLSFTCDTDGLGDGVLLVGHGIRYANGSWVEIRRNTVKACTYYTYGGENNGPRTLSLLDEEHGVNISGFISVKIDVDATGEGQTLVLASSGGMYKTAIKGWSGQSGAVAAMPEGCTVENCKLNWFSDNYAKRIWFIGDSYLGNTNPSRWPYYLYRDGYSDVLLTGYAGMGTVRGLQEFKLAVTKGTPVFCAWCLGMNNGDSKEDGTVNADWIKATEEFLAICKERGITPILSTVPSTPKVNNDAKNKWVRASGFRYIDFARAVGAGKDINWYEGMLYSDLIHPDVSGAQALYMQVLADFPEVMQRP